jgi:hypothetical protein
VNYSPFPKAKYCFGALVEIENDQGLRNRFRIVGAEEIINTNDYISMDSPMAQAMINKKVGDEATVKTTAGTFVWRVIKIEYQKYRNSVIRERNPRNLLLNGRMFLFNGSQLWRSDHACRNLTSNFGYQIRIQ